MEILDGNSKGIRSTLQRLSSFLAKHSLATEPVSLLFCSSDDFSDTAADGSITYDVTVEKYTL